MSIHGTYRGMGATQNFEYTFTGSEGTHFAVTLPYARANTNYGIQITGETEPNTFTWSYDTKTTTNFNLRTSSQVGAGLKVAILVEDIR